VLIRKYSIYGHVGFFFKRNGCIDQSFDNNKVNLIEVNFDFELEKLLKEVHYLLLPPLKIELTDVGADGFMDLKNNFQLRYSLFLLIKPK
jgi:hypothetical protein